jgi:hypothetical protein
MSTLNTDFNVSPYYDDYDGDKKFHRVLFKPAVALQARELTQLQTILQAQVSRFGNNIYKEGTIIEGCQIKLDSDYDYIKITDLQTDGQPVAPSTYLNYYAKGATSNVVAIVQQYADGLVSQNPNLTTLYVDYLTTGITDAKTFTSTENIEIYSDEALTTLVTTVTVGGAQVANAATCVGQGYAVHCSEGIIYSKGHFVSVSEGLVIASKYTDLPDNVSVGYDVTETIVTSNADSSLLDNASGYNNENAPGADRLKLNPFLVAIPTQDARSNSNFMAVMDFQQGLPIAKKLTTQFNTISDEMALRTQDESGDYTIRKNHLSTEPITANTSHFNVLVGPGLHYVGGFRSEQFNTTRLPVQKAAAFASSEDQVVTQNMGSYFIVDQVVGGFSSNTVSTVSLRDTAGTSVTDNDNLAVSPGNEIGTAKVKAFAYHSGVQGTSKAQFKVYVFDVKMSAGKAVRDIKSLHINGAGTGDIVLVNSRAVLNESQMSTNLWPLPARAIKATSSSDYIYRTEKQATTSSNTLTVTTVTGVFPYSGTLTNEQKKEFIIRPTTTAGGLANNVAVDTDKCTISVSSTTATIDLTSALGSGITTSKAFNVTFNEKKTNVTPLKKTLKEVFVKVDCNTNAGGTTGPWSLGLPDVDSIEAIYVGSTYSASNSETKIGFRLEKNSRDNFYGISQLVKKSSQSLSGTDKLLIKCKVFEAADPASGAGFYTASSYYKADGVTLLDPQDIPVYVSDTGFKADLRDTLDTRPQAANTAAYAATASAATINPSATESFGSIDHFLAAPDKQFQTDIQYYLGRIDKLALTTKGYIVTKRGAPASTPVPPQDPPGALVLGTIVVPPFPSLTSKEARDKLRTNESIVIQPSNTKRYTMKDISKLDKRLKNLEYYTTLSQLEQKTQNMAITDENGNDRFKNGIFVDPATDFNSADTRNLEFNIGIDESSTEYHPKFKKEIIDLKVQSSTNMISRDGVFMLSPNETNFISQDEASNYRPCTSVFYKYVGKVKMTPSYDAGYDETTVPTKDIYVDTSTGVKDLLDNIQDVLPMTKTSIEHMGTSSSNTVDTNTTSDTNFKNYGYWGWDGWGGYDHIGHEGYYGYGGNYGHNNYWGGWGWPQGYTTETAVTTTTTTTTDTYLKTTQQLAMGYEENTTEVGDFVTDITFSPFMRAKVIKIIVSGLRPNTRHYLFFDNTDQNANFRPGAIDSLASSTSTLLNNAENVRKAGDYNDAVTSDSFGMLFAEFKLTKGTFNVGDRQMVIADVATLNQMDNATSTASGTYSAYNYSVDKQGVTLTTRQPTFDYETTGTETYGEDTIDIDTDVSVTNTYAYNWWWHEDYYDNIYIDPVGNTQDASTTQEYPYNVNTGITIIANTYVDTTTGTGSKANTAITGSGGGGGRFSIEEVSAYKLR